MEKQKIGKWNSYNVFLHKSKKPYWTIESNGKVHNRFDDKESFGHWMYHSGFKPSRSKDKKLVFKK